MSRYSQRDKKLHTCDNDHSSEKQVEKLRVACDYAVIIAPDRYLWPLSMTPNISCVRTILWFSLLSCFMKISKEVLGGATGKVMHLVSPQEPQGSSQEGHLPREDTRTLTFMKIMRTHIHTPLAVCVGHC